MSDPVFLSKGDDPEMERASEKARATFKYFWRELYWERRRIVPGLDLAIIKLAFSDGDGAVREDGTPDVEHMWVADVDFDGMNVSGTLMNSPNWIKSVKEGDHVSVPFGQLGDWMYSIYSTAYGGYTINLMRSRMPKGERRAHDSAWGLDFGDPNHITVIPPKDAAKPKGFLSRLFAKKEEPPTDPATQEFSDHPMCINMTEKIDQQLGSDPSIIRNIDRNGWTLLHHEALAGNLAIVKLALKYGCDPNVQTKDGRTALDLAAVMGWAPIVEVLGSARP